MNDPLNLGNEIKNEEYEILKSLSEGDVVETSCYKNKLVVTGVVTKQVGVKVYIEFLDESVRNETEKYLMAMTYGDGIHLHKGSSSVENINLEVID